jgi:hypothetical protein
VEGITPPGIVTRDRLRLTQAARPDWALDKHASEVYEIFRFRGTQPPPLHRGTRYPLVNTSSCVGRLISALGIAINPDSFQERHMARKTRRTTHRSRTGTGGPRW